MVFLSGSGDPSYQRGDQGTNEVQRNGRYVFYTSTKKPGGYQPAGFLLLRSIG